MRCLLVRMLWWRLELLQLLLLVRRIALEGLHKLLEKDKLLGKLIRYSLQFVLSSY